MSQNQKGRGRDQRFFFGRTTTNVEKIVPRKAAIVIGIYVILNR